MRRAFGLLVALGLGASPFACNGIQTAPPDLVTIRGQVTKHGVGLPNAKVWGIDRAAHDGGVDAGPPPMPTTDGTGHFVLGGFGTTYDLVVEEDGAKNVYTIVSGLTRRDPVVSLDDTSAATHEAHVAVTWTALPPDGASIDYFFLPPAYPGVRLVDARAAGPSIDDGITVRWSGGFSTTAFVQALVYSVDGTGTPSNFLTTNGGYGWFADDGTVPVTFTPAPVDTSPATLQAQTPDGYSLSTLDVGLDFGAGGTPVYFSHLSSPSAPVQLTLPNVPGNRVNVRGTATRGEETAVAFALGNSLSGQTTSLSMDLAAASQLSAPADGATDVDPAVAFAWDGTGVNEIFVTSAAPNAVQLHIVTADAQFSLASITAATSVGAPAGIGLTRDATYSWSTRRWPDYPTTDSISGADTDLSVARLSTGLTRTFTTAAP